MVTQSKHEKKITGSHYTPVILADFVARSIASAYTKANPKILDPACGDGQLLESISRFFPKAVLSGFDIDDAAVVRTSLRVTANVEKLDFLEYVFENYSDDLLQQAPQFDIIIANPPYIRTQVLGAKKAQQISQTFKLSGRIDIYYAFLEGIYRVLADNGIVGIIVSNRFMSIKSGALIRKRILERFDLIHVWDFGDTKIFDAAVLPAVLLLKKKSAQKQAAPKISTIYSTCKQGKPISVYNPIEAINVPGFVSIADVAYEVCTGKLDYSDDVWKISNDISDEWTATVASHTFMKFGDIGKVRVGIKTTADKVFVKKQWNIKTELLKPLITHHDRRRFKSFPPSHSVLYPHEIVSGKRSAVDLEKYPSAKDYLTSHKTALCERKYLIEAKREWYELWVPQNPAFWRYPKLVFPDISEKPMFWISLDEEVIQGDCYWIIIEDNKDQDLLWLALAVGNSTFIEEYYDRNFNNKLYSGRRRFMTQYVEKFPLPDPNTKDSKKLIALAKKIYMGLANNSPIVGLQAELEILVYGVFGLKETSR